MRPKPGSRPILTTIMSPDKNCQWWSLILTLDVRRLGAQVQARGGDLRRSDLRERANDMSVIEGRNVMFYRLFEPVSKYVAACQERASLLRQARCGRAATRQLLTYDDRILDDIGVSRSDVREALASSWDTDPALKLAEIRRWRLQAARQCLLEHRVL